MKRFRYFLFTIFILLTAINIYIYKKRFNGFEYVQQSVYQNLYPNISKGLSAIKIEKDSLAIIYLKGYSDTLNWNIACNDITIKNKQPLPIIFFLKQNVNRYTLTSNDTTLSPVIVDLDYSPTEIYQSSGNSTKTNYEIRYCNVPFITTDSNSVYKWKDRLNYTSSDEIDSVKKILTYQLKLSTHTTSIQKIKTIGHFLYSSLKNSFGVPPDSLANYSTYQQFCMAKDGKQKIWCGNITDIFHLFASAAGLTTRKIGFSGKKYGFTTGEHTANECYIPETGEWAYVDITQNILLLTNEYHKIVNTIDLIHLKKMNQTDKLITFKSTDSSIVQSNYDYPDKKYGWEENEIYFVHPHNPSTLYSFSNKLKRYFTRSPWIELYSENQYYSNQKFYLKIYLFYTWVLIGLLILISYLFTFKRTH